MTACFVYRISPETASAQWEEIGACVAKAGIRKLVLYNSHGGNHALAEVVARRLRLEHGMIAALALNLAMDDGTTPLHIAVKYGYEGCAAVLIQAGADVHRCTDMGKTPIKLAMFTKHEGIVKLLRQLGARDD